MSVAEFAMVISPAMGALTVMIRALTTASALVVASRRWTGIQPSATATATAIDDFITVTELTPLLGARMGEGSSVSSGVGSGVEPGSLLRLFAASSNRQSWTASSRWESWALAANVGSRGSTMVESANGASAVSTGRGITLRRDRERCEDELDDMGTHAKQDERGSG